MDSDLFRICANDDLATSYACCLKHCGSARMCPALCRDIYPGTIPEDCAAFIGCSRPNFVNSKCISDTQPAFRNCCLERCKAGQWSDVPSIAREFQRLPIVPVDCVKYCDAAEGILLDKRYDLRAPSTWSQ